MVRCGPFFISNINSPWSGNKLNNSLVDVIRVHIRGGRGGGALIGGRGCGGSTTLVTLLRRARNLTIRFRNGRLRSSFLSKSPGPTIAKTASVSTRRFALAPALF